jgi:NAD/NADP transhydrogenase beta subunit
MAAAAIVMFIIAAFLFITSNGDPGKVGAARQSIIWAVIGLAVAIVAFSLPYIIRNTLAGGGF